jgi:hypothetical protein
METSDSSTSSYTLEHINRVKAKMEFFASVLATRGANHDSSKLKEPEYSGWLAMDKEPRYPYGSKKYYDKMFRYKEVLEHHYSINSHHPEHFEDPSNQMDLIDLIEMLCDWFSYSNDISWLEGYNTINSQCARFKLNDTIKHLLLNTFRNFLVASLRVDDSIWSTSEKAIADIILRKAADEKGWGKMSDTELTSLEDIADEIFQKQLVQIDKLKMLKSNQNYY